MSALQPSLLIVDDEAVARQNLAHAFCKDGYQVTTCADGATALAELRRGPRDLVLTDLRMPGIDGMALLEECRVRWPQTRVIMLTGFASLDNAVAAMKAGAFHYLAKPFRLTEVRELVARALEVIHLERENRALRDQVAALQPGVLIITQDPALRALLETARRLAATQTSILIGGESGTGKELLARFIHEGSPRSGGPFVAINCGALHEELLANELFGHEKGAFTGAQALRRGLIETADAGTLFLDEIGETSQAMQVKLLRVLEQRELFRVGGNQPVQVDVRFVAATNRNLADAVQEGRFRSDLFYRLNVVELHLPPLADRAGDVPLLALHFLRYHSARLGRRVRDIAAEAMELLTSYDYPGNVRELANLIERGVALADGDTLEARHLPEHLRAVRIKVLRQPEDRLPTLEEQERRYILQILKRTGGNRTQAAQILGIDRVSLWRKLKRFGLEEGT
jgi:DNA-binding NtrC family response regulator